MASLAQSPSCQNGEQTEDAKYPPVVLGRLDDRSGWRWIDPKPIGVVDWTLTALMVVLAIPVVVMFGPVVWIIRLFDRKAVA